MNSVASIKEFHETMDSKNRQGKREYLRSFRQRSKHFRNAKNRGVRKLSRDKDTGQVIRGSGQYE